VGIRVEAYFKATARGDLSLGSWDPGTVAVTHPDGTFDVLYDDGYAEDGVAYYAGLRPLPALPPSGGRPRFGIERRRR